MQFLFRKPVSEPDCNLDKKLRLKSYLRTRRRVQEETMQAVWVPEAGMNSNPSELTEKSSLLLWRAVPVCSTELLGGGPV